MSGENDAKTVDLAYVLGEMSRTQQQLYETNQKLSEFNVALVQTQTMIRTYNGLVERVGKLEIKAATENFEDLTKRVGTLEQQSVADTSATEQKSNMAKAIQNWASTIFAAAALVIAGIGSFVSKH